jgi:hypothetical protein
MFNTALECLPAFDLGLQIRYLFHKLLSPVNIFPEIRVLSLLLKFF